MVTLRLSLFAYLLGLSFLLIVYSFSKPKIKRNRRKIISFICLLWIVLVLVNAFIYYDHRPLFNAIELNDFEKIQSIISLNKDLVNAKTLFGNTPLHYAAEFGNREAVNLLLKAGASINAKNYNKATPLHLAVKKNNKEALLALIDGGAKIDVFGYRSNITPLHLAVINGDDDIVKILLNSGAKINLKDRQGETPLDLAIERKNRKVILLLKNGV
jgi:ankyrin repeat protein